MALSFFRAAGLGAEQGPWPPGQQGMEAQAWPALSSPCQPDPACAGPSCLLRGAGPLPKLRSPSQFGLEPLCPG